MILLTLFCGAAASISSLCFAHNSDTWYLKNLKHLRYLFSSLILLYSPLHLEFLFSPSPHLIALNIHSPVEYIYFTSRSSMVVCVVNWPDKTFSIFAKQFDLTRPRINWHFLTVRFKNNMNWSWPPWNWSALQPTHLSSPSWRVPSPQAPLLTRPPPVWRSAPSQSSGPTSWFCWIGLWNDRI